MSANSGTIEVSQKRERCYWQAYTELPPAIKQQVQKTYRLWREHLQHPSLHFKTVGKNLWFVRVSAGYRALALKEGDDYYWLWVSIHDQYDALLR